MGAPPMPLIVGRRYSTGPVGISRVWAPHSSARVTNAKGHAAGSGTVFFGEPRREAVRLGVHDKVDVALSVELDCLGAMIGNVLEVEHRKYGFAMPLLGSGEFYELETFRFHQIVEQIGHDLAPPADVGTVYIFVVG
jgi:hypothetical protein